MNQQPMYDMGGMGGMPFGGGYGGFGGFGGGYGGGFNPMFGGIGGLGFNPMFGPGFGQPMSPFGGGMGRNFGGFGGGFGGYPQFGGFGGGFGGYPQFGGFGGFGGFNPMFGGIGGLGFNPFMGPEFGRRMPQRDLRNELFGNAQKPQPAVKQVPEDISDTMENFPQVDESSYWQSEYNKMYPANRMTMDVAPTMDQFIQNRKNSLMKDFMTLSGARPVEY